MTDFIHIGLPYSSNAIDTWQRENKKHGRFYEILTKDSTYRSYPSVTTVLGVAPTPELDDWKNNYRYAEVESRIASSDGGYMHKMCEQYLMNMDPYKLSEEMPIISPRAKMLFKRMKARFEENEINNILALEQPLYSDSMCVAGATDCIAFVKGKKSLVDFKTSKKIKTVDMIHGYIIQTWCYAVMFEEMYNEEIEQLVIMIANDHQPIAQQFIFPLEPGVRMRCKRTFLEYMNIYREHLWSVDTERALQTPRKSL